MRKVWIACCSALFVLLVAFVSRRVDPASRTLADVNGSIPGELRSDTDAASGEEVLARAFASVPGAVICRDYKTVTTIAMLYARAADEQSEDLLTHGQSRLLRGPAVAAPEPSKFGCVLIAPGVRLMLDPGNLVPVVSAKIGGHWLRGVTLPDMISRPLTTRPLSPSDMPAPDPHTEVATRFASPTFWLPANEPAETTTGQIEFSTEHVVLAGHGYPLVLQNVLRPQQLTEAANVFGLPSASAAEGFWFRVAVPESAPMLGDKTLCGNAEAVWMLALAEGEQRDALTLAFYSARQTPDLAPPSPIGTSHLCGAYTYIPFSSREAALRNTREP
jgi:hypothetical protein